MPKKPKSAVAKPNNLPPQKPSFEKMREIVAQGLTVTDDPKHIIEEAYEHFSQGKDGPAQGEDKALARQAAFALAFENDYSLVETMEPEYRPMAIELRRQLIKDFDCKTYSEKVLVDAIVSGYMRTVSCARAFTLNIHREFMSAVANTHMATMSKEMDRAQRQLTTAMQMLIQLKRPPLNVQVKAKTAFVAQNQQLNVNKNDHPA